MFEQQNENEMVKKELMLAEDDAKIFKLIGPILVPIPLNESRCIFSIKSECGETIRIHWKRISKSRWACETKREEINGKKITCVEDPGTNV